MRDLRTFTYLFRLSVKAFGLFVTYVTMCLNLFWIRLKLFFITCSQIILDARQLIRLKNIETRTGLLHHPAFSPVKSNNISKISPLVNQHCSFDNPQRSFWYPWTVISDLFFRWKFWRFRFPFIPVSYLVIMFRLGLLFQNDKIIIHH